MRFILLTMDGNTIDPAKSIPLFYTGQSIFLTGVTGFLGKVYIEKILRSCPDVQEIFLLMRSKKGLSLNERLEEMLNSPVSQYRNGYLLQHAFIHTAFL